MSSRLDRGRQRRVLHRQGQERHGAHLERADLAREIHLAYQHMPWKALRRQYCPG